MLAVLSSTTAACAGGGGPRTPPPVEGPLAIHIVYPPQQERGRRAGDGATFRADSSFVFGDVDSVFVFGSVGRGNAGLTVNGRPVTVYPSGGWLAWLPLPDDTVARFHIEAVSRADTARATYMVRAPGRDRRLPASQVIDLTSFSPAGDRWLRDGEGVRLLVRAAAGAQASIVRASGDTIPLLPYRVREPIPWGRGHSASPAMTVPDSTGAEWYEAWWVGPLGPDPGHVMSPAFETLEADSAWARLEVVLGDDTARVRWPLRMGVVGGPAPPLAVVNDDTATTGATDSVLPGRPTPYGTYHWFFPTGTVAAVSGRANDQVRLQLSARAAAWVDARDVQPLRPGTPPPVGIARPPRLLIGREAVTLRVPLSAKIPFRVEERTRGLTLRLYGVAADMDFIEFGGSDPFVRLISFDQPAEDELLLSVDLAQPVWGYRTRWDGTDLRLEIRRPPAIDAGHPLRGRHIAIDPGHPPAGATGPTGVRESEVTLAVALQVRELLEADGARVTMLRMTASSVSLDARLEALEAADPEVLVSIHANALPDGVNPFERTGTSVYYYHPRSVSLARALNRALVSAFRSRDLGVGRGDLALVRPTWMPAALTEGLFLMVPDQEMVLASEAGQSQYARGVANGIVEFLLERAATSQ